VSRTPGFKELPELAANVYEIKNIALREVARVQNDKSLPTDDRQSTLAEVQGAVEEAILKVLGRKGFEAYLKQPGSAWLQHLTTRPAMAASE
jgi:hypothetical protein